MIIFLEFFAIILINFIFGITGVLYYFAITFAISVPFILGTLVTGDFLACGLIAIRDLVWVFIGVCGYQYDKWQEKQCM